MRPRPLRRESGGAGARWAVCPSGVDFVVEVDVVAHGVVAALRVDVQRRARLDGRRLAGVTDDHVGAPGDVPLPRDPRLSRYPTKKIPAYARNPLIQSRIGNANPAPSTMKPQTHRPRDAPLKIRHVRLTKCCMWTCAGSYPVAGRNHDVPGSQCTALATGTPAVCRPLRHRGKLHDRITGWSSPALPLPLPPSRLSRL